MKREFALGIKSVSSILSREVVYASLFKHCPYLFIGVWVRPDSEAGFSIGVYHTGQPPILDVKGKGGIPSMEAGTNEWIKIVRSKDAHSKSGCWTRVCGFRTGKSRYKVVVRKQCSRWKRNHLLSCCSRQLLAKDSFACRRSSRLAQSKNPIPLQWPETRFRPSEDPNLRLRIRAATDTNSRADYSRSHLQC